MKCQKIDSNNWNSLVVEAVESLKMGEVIVHPSDTCYGFACDVLSERAVEKFYKVKKMPREKPTSILVDSIEMAQQYGVFSGDALKMVKEMWPAPVTVIVKRNESLPEFFNVGTESVGIRWPDDRLCCEMISGLGGPIATTSANLSGMKEVYEVDDLLMQFENSEGEVFLPHLIVDGGRQEKRLPSTIVSFVNGEMEMVRQGDLKLPGLD